MAGQAYKRPEHITVRIASGATTSEAFCLLDRVLLSLHMPAAFTGSAITFMASTTKGGTYLPLYADSDQVSLAVAASRAVAVVGNEAAAIGASTWLKLVSDQSEEADRDIVLLMKG